jgi:hypothetical protein
MRTNAGTDLVCKAIGDTATQPAAANYLALSANSGARNAGDTTLASEITTASGGLIRKQCVFAHTNGTSTYTETATHTANGNDSLPVTIASAGLLNASSSGTLAFEWLYSTTATISAVGDALTTTFTGTIS